MGGATAKGESETEALALLILWAEMVTALLFGGLVLLAILLLLVIYIRSTKLVPVQTDESEPYEAPEN